MNEDVELKVKRIINNLIVDYPFFACLALKMPVKKMDKKENHYCKTACTDGETIKYDENFITRLTLEEGLFIFIHEVMHCALGHLWRRENRIFELWNVATDLAINSIIKEYIDEMEKKKNVNCKRIQMPKGVLYDERYVGMSADEIYSILRKDAKIKKNKKQQGNGQGNQNGQNGQGQGGGSQSQKQDDNQQGNGGSSNGKGKQQKNKNGNGGSGGSQSNQQDNQNGQGNQNGFGGYDDYEDLPSSGGGTVTANGRTYQIPDNHSSWNKADKMTEEEKTKQKIKWDSAMLGAAEACKGQGNMPLGIERGLSSIRKPQKDWRVLLQEFIQEEYNDYSLMPPDKRFESDFFMFDFNDTVEVVNDILFFVDTSGSMGETAINMCFSEIQGAINQFEKHLHGKLFFFDHEVAENHYDFDDVNGNVADLAVFGGGGTSFATIFKYIRNHREDFDNINGVIVLTDGYCDYPDEELTDGLPVLWIYTTPETEHGGEPPFGRSAILDESKFRD